MIVLLTYCDRSFVCCSSTYGQKQQQMHKQLEQLKQEKFEMEHGTVSLALSDTL